MKNLWVLALMMFIGFGASAAEEKRKPAATDGVTPETADVICRPEGGAMGGISVFVRFGNDIKVENDAVAISQGASLEQLTRLKMTRMRCISRIGVGCFSFSGKVKKTKSTYSGELDTDGGMDLRIRVGSGKSASESEVELECTKS